MRVLFQEPKQLDPSLILVSPLNRDGAPPNVQHIHFKILKGVLEKGFDRTRPAVGICVKYLSEQGKKDLLEHNRRFTKGNKLLPPVNEEALYGSLACSRLNMALRCIQAGLQSPAGNLQDLMDDAGNLKDAVLNGHKWWVLPETVPAERQVDISLWRNMDQNENQATHEIEILQSIRMTCEDLSKKAGKVSHGDLMSAVARKNPFKMSTVTLQTLCKFFVGFVENGAADLVEDLVDWHSCTVDPKALLTSMWIPSSWSPEWTSGGMTWTCRTHTSFHPG